MADTPRLLSTAQMAEIAARGVLRFDAVVPDELTLRAIDEFRRWGLRPFSRPTPASLTPLSDCDPDAVIGEVLRLPAVHGIIASSSGPDRSSTTTSSISAARRICTISGSTP